jgi:hypothetical protein
MSKNEIRSEAMRYVDNAKEILSTKAGKEGKYYNDPKYIKMAGNTLWNGALLALDHKFPEIKKGKGRPDQTKYRQRINDGKVSKMFDQGYYYTHLVMGYDGQGTVAVVKEAIDDVTGIINWATES